MSSLDDSDAQASPVWPELEAVALPARERRRLPPDTRSRIILELCALSPLSVKELSILTDRSEAYIGDAIRPLVTAGQLTFLYPDQPRHPKQKYLTRATRVLRAGAGSDARAGAGAGDSAGESAGAGAGAGIAKTPAPAQAPTPAPAPAPAPTRAPAPPPAHAPAPKRGRARVTNVAAVMAVGILLAMLRPDAWAAYAVLAALALTLAHIATSSTQYERFLALQASQKKRSFAFVLLKTGVAMTEIVIVYYIISAFTNQSGS